MTNNMTKSFISWSAFSWIVGTLLAIVIAVIGGLHSYDNIDKDRSDKTFYELNKTLNEIRIRLNVLEVELHILKTSRKDILGDYNKIINRLDRDIDRLKDKVQNIEVKVYKCLKNKD